MKTEKYRSRCVIGTNTIPFSANRTREITFAYIALCTICDTTAVLMAPDVLDWLGLDGSTKKSPGSPFCGGISLGGSLPKICKCNVQPSRSYGVPCPESSTSSMLSKHGEHCVLLCTITARSRDIVGLFAMLWSGYH